MSVEERLFCVDVAVENLTILKTIGAPNQLSKFDSCSLLAQFLTFTPLRLADDLSGTLLIDSALDRKIVRLQTGKSALLRSDRRNLIEKLKTGYLVLALVGINEGQAMATLLLSAQLSLSTAASYFIENGQNGVDDQGYPLKFTSAGVVDLKDEFGRKRADLQIGYRLWQLGSSMDDFFSQHEQLEQRSGTSAAAWLPTNLIGQVDNSSKNEVLVLEEKTSVTTDTQTDVRNVGAISDAGIQTDVEVKISSIEERSVSVSGSVRSGKSSKLSVTSGRNSGQENAKSSSSSASSSNQSSKKSGSQHSKNKLQRPLSAPSKTQPNAIEAWTRKERDSSVRRLITDLERLTRNNSAEQRENFELKNVSNKSKQLSIIQNPTKNQVKTQIENRILDEQRSLRQKKAIRAYELGGNGPTNSSFNLYSKLYLNKANGYSITKSYLQRLAYYPLYHGPITVTVPSRQSPIKKIYMKDEATICDLSADPKSMLSKTSETQTDQTPTFQKRRTRSASSTRSRPKSRSAVTLNDIRLLIQAVGESRNQPEIRLQTPVQPADLGPQKSKRLLSMSQRSASALGQRRQSMVRPVTGDKNPRRMSRISNKNGQIGKSASRSRSTSSIKSEPPSRGPSPFTESVATAIEAESTGSENDYSSVPEQLSSSGSNSSSGSSKQSAATAVEQPVMDNSRRPSRATVASTDDVMSRSRLSSYGTANSVKFRTTAQNRNVSGGGTPDLKNKKEETAPPLSPVSEYLNEFRLREAVRQQQLAQRALSVRTESVSSYMPSDVDHLAYSSNSSPLQMSGNRLH